MTPLEEECLCLIDGKTLVIKNNKYDIDANIKIEYFIDTLGGNSNRFILKINDDMYRFSSTSVPPENLLAMIVIVILIKNQIEEVNNKLIDKILANTNAF